MKSAFIQLKNGYNTAIPNVEFLTNEGGRLELWGKQGRVGIFLTDKVEMCVITEKWPQKEESNG